jgi:hypothetical protein
MVDRNDPMLLGFLKRLLNPDKFHELNPDLDAALVLADWLSEQDDPRAGDVRALAQARALLAECPALDPSVEKVFWRWPAPEATERPWYDFLIESLPRGKFYVRWHVDSRTEVGRTFGKCLASGETCPRDRIPRVFEAQLATLIAALFGWNEVSLEKS